jgi:hypothetical protein
MALGQQMAQTPILACQIGLSRLQNASLIRELLHTLFRIVERRLKLFALLFADGQAVSKFHFIAVKLLL